MKKYTFFWDGPFSNWYPAPFQHKEHYFANSEQAFMWEKAITFNDEDTADEILMTTNPRDCKKLGKLVAGFSNEVWDKYKFHIMCDVVAAKFSQNPELKRQLFENSNFVEASPTDLCWGVGLAKSDPLILDEANWRGENLLGKALDTVRETLMHI